MGRPVNNFSVAPEQMIRHMQMKAQLQEGLPGAPPTQSDIDDAAQMPTTPGTLDAMYLMEYANQAKLFDMFGSGKFPKKLAEAAINENFLRNREPSMNMLPARAAQMREEEQYQAFLRRNKLHVPQNR
tara:strand:- start:622 stop:1005 length:384 start_codon:yes stop_codon:yes gene_type:complete